MPLGHAPHRGPLPVTTVIRIPTRFYDDHVDVGDLPAPPVLRATSRHYWIDLDHPDARELIDDAEFYLDSHGPDLAPAGVVSGARGLLNAIRRQLPVHLQTPSCARADPA